VEVSKIKNLVIAALVLLNIVFLVSFLWGKISEDANHRKALEYLSTVMAQNGIALDTKVIDEGEELQYLKTSRDRTGEERAVEAILGETVMTDQGGNIFYYKSQDGDGEALFQNGGVFDFALKKGVIEISGSAEATVKRLLQGMAINADVGQAEDGNGHQTVTAVCSWGKTPIYNCIITFEFTDGSLVRINGKRAMNIEATDEKIGMYGAETAILSFLEEVNKGEINCTKIECVRSGYYLVSASAVDNGELKAVWQLVTDNGTYYVDASTGIVERGL
jgi:hypothetical protein